MRLPIKYSVLAVLTEGEEVAGCVTPWWDGAKTTSGDVLTCFAMGPVGGEQDFCYTV
jgi:hypothetical protein